MTTLGGSPSSVTDDHCSICEACRLGRASAVITINNGCRCLDTCLAGAAQKLDRGVEALLVTMQPRMGRHSM